MRTMMALLAMAVAASAQDGRSDDLRKLEAVRLSVDWKETPIPAALDYLREITGMNFVYRGDPDTRVTLRVKEVSASSVLKLALEPHGYALVYQGGAFVVGSRSDLPSRLKLEVYDVKEISYPLQDFFGVDIQLAVEGLGVAPMLSAQEPAPAWGEMLEDLVRSSTGGTSWDDEEGVSVRLNNGILFVRQTPEVHAEIKKLIRLLARSR